MIVLALVLAFVPGPHRADECRYMTADGRPGYSTGEVRKAIGCFADRFGVNEDDALSVAECESHLRPRAVNGSYRGVYQIGPVWDSWWASARDLSRSVDLRASVWNVRSNVGVAIRRARGGWGPWAGCAP